MEQQLNRIEIIGNVGSVRQPQSGTNQAVNFTVATNYVYMDRNGCAQGETTWHNVVAWGIKGMPDLSAITVGTCVHVIGRLRTYRYTGSDSIEKTSYEIIASKVDILPEALPMQTGF